MDNKSPYHLLFRSESDYQSLKSFGRWAYVATLSSTRNKFTLRAIPLVFVSYPRGYKDYKLYNLQTKHFYISRDIVFHEEIFPFKIVTNDQEVPNSLSDYVVSMPLLDFPYFAPNDDTSIFAYSVSTTTIDVVLPPITDASTHDVATNEAFVPVISEQLPSLKRSSKITKVPTIIYV